MESAASQSSDSSWFSRPCGQSKEQSLDCFDRYRGGGSGLAMTIARRVGGAGADSDGEIVAFVTYYIALNDGKIAEIWFSVMKDDKPGLAAAMKVLDSFRTP